MAGLSVNIGADIKPLTTGLAQAKQELNSFSKAAQTTNSALNNIKPGANQAAAALTNVGRVAQDLPFGFIGIQNNLNPLLESFQRLKTETGSSGAALKALGSSLVGAGGIGLALSIVSSAFLIFQNGIAGFNRKSKEAKEAADDLEKSIRSISSIQGEAAASVEGQISKVNALAAALSDSNRPYEQRKRALEELKDINKSYFKDLELEDAATGALTKTVQEYTNALINSAIQKQFVDEIAKVAKAAVDSDAEINRARIKLTEAQDKERRANEVANATRREGVTIDNISINAKREVAKAEQALSAANEKSTKLLEQEAVLRDNLNRAVAEGLKFKDLDTQSTKKEEDALKKRLEALEKIKAATEESSKVTLLHGASDNIEAAIKSLSELELKISDLKIQIATRDAKKNGLSADELKQQIDAIRNETQANIDKLIGNQRLLLQFRTSLRVEKEKIDQKDISSQIAKATGFDKRIPEITLHDVRIKLLGVKLTAEIEDKEKINEALIKQVKSIFEGGLSDVMAEIGEGFGEAIATADFGEGLKRAAQGIMAVVGGVMQQLGRALIEAAIKIKFLKEAFEKWAIANPGLAIIAGIGLVAAGAALKNIKFDGPKFAQGGIVTGPIIGQVGEMHRPEVVMPLDRLPAMLRQFGGGSGGDMQFIPIINSEQLYLLAKRGERRAGRKF